MNIRFWMLGTSERCTWDPSDLRLAGHESKKSSIAISVAVSLQGFLCNNAVMMVLAFIAAMLLGGFPTGFGINNGTIAMLSLMVMMSLSLTALKLKGLKIKSHSKAIRNAFLLSFVLSSGTPS